MQLSASATTAKPLPVDLVPEFPPSFLFPHIRRKAAITAGKVEWALKNSKAAPAALNDPRWLGRVALLLFLSCNFVKEV